MKKHSQNKKQIAAALGMIVLLALAAFAPVMGGFLQQRHRVVRQGNLRRGRIDFSPVRIVLTDSAVADCFIPKKNELELGGLQYDIVSVSREGNSVVFNAIPDLKETLIRSLTLKSILFPSGEAAQKTSFAMLNYLFNEQILPQIHSVLDAVRTVFLAKKAMVLAGFEWVFTPPPELARL